MVPCSSTIISSAFFTVWSRCATITTVRPTKSRSSASVIASSEKLSKALVGSSSKIISGSFRNIFAIASRCFCPPESRTPRSPISVSSHFSSSNTNSHFASLRACMSLSSVVGSSVLVSVSFSVSFFSSLSFSSFDVFDFFLTLDDSFF